jgi:hypothetical protein
MPIRIHKDIIQGSDEWLAIRCGLLTASEMDKVLTPTLKVAANESSRAHVWEIAAQRISRFVEPSYVSDDMLRGRDEEILARAAYAANYGPVEEVGFVTNDSLGFVIGCSPDGMVGDDGIIEIKSRKQKYQIETIISRRMPDTSAINCMLQIQTALFVTGRKWCDFVSYHGGLPMVVYRIEPDLKMQEAIVRAAMAFEGDVVAKIAEWEAVTKDPTMRLVPTERVILDEITV